MMTGQILGGSPVTEAAHYQILIMYLIATITFFAILLNLYIVYRVAFDAGTHVLRTDRFIEVVDTKQKMGIVSSMMGFVRNCCCPMRRRPQEVIGNNSETQPLQYSSNNTNMIKIVTGQKSTSEPIFRIAKLSFSVPKTHQKKRRSEPDPSSVQQSSTPSALEGGSYHQSQQRVLCTNLDTNLSKGEIGIVRGPSGSGKSTLLRVLAGLTPMDDGDVMTSGLSLVGCSGQGDGHDMVEWRTTVRYVTQSKADLPGTPRDFIARVASFHTPSMNVTTVEDEMMSHTNSYLEQWGLCGNKQRDDYSYEVSSNHQGGNYQSYLDKEWKTLSGGESQRMLLAIAMASRATILLLDEATSGLDNETEKLVENSVVEYATKNGAAVLWVTHSDDIAERLLARQQ
jgi:ABC-type iron transport system FetAB ATPase subunit